MSNEISIDLGIKHKSLKVRIYPNENQKILINKTFGCCRKLYNEHLQERVEFYINNILPIKNKISEKERLDIYKTFKPKTEKEWKIIYPYLKEVSNDALQQSRRNCDNAFLNFFKSKNRSRKGKMNFPKFKSKKDNRQSFKNINIYNDCRIKYENREIKIPKIGIVKFKNRNKPKWFNQIIKLSSLTVEKSCSNNYFVSLLFEVENQNFEKFENRKESLGLDFSPAELYINSEGKSGKDFREKETLRLVKNYNKIVVEDLNLKEISKFLTNAKNMNDTSWGIFVSRLVEKGKEYNCQIVKANRYFPSSQLCSVCGFQNHNLKLSDRFWKCPNCKTEHIRDINAAINLRNYSVSWEAREFKSVENLEDSEKIFFLENQRTR